MAAAFLLTLLLLLAPANLGAQAIAPAEAPAGEMSLTESLEQIARLSPRHEGSAEEKALVAWITGRLSAMGLAASTLDFSQSDFEHSFSACLRVDIPGASRDTLILAVPLNTPIDATAPSDGSVSIALALDVLSHLRGTTPGVSLTVLFLGAEYGESDVYPMGSTLFLRDFQPDFRAAVIYLNLRTVPRTVLVRGGARGIVTPYWLMNRTADRLQAAHIPFRMEGETTQIFRMGATDERTMIEPWLRAGYPAVGLEGEYAAGGDDARWMQSFSAFLQGAVTGTVGIPEEWDRHYLLLQAAGLTLIVREELYVGILAAVLAALLLYSLVFRRGLKKYLRTLRRNLPAILPLALLCFIFLAVGTFAVQGILSLRRFPVLWQYAPLQFLALKICVALFLYAALYNVFRRLPFPRNGSFYSAAALFFLLIDIIVVAAFNVSFTYYFLWAFVFLFLSALVPNRWVKALLVIPAPLLGIRGIITVFLTPALPFCHFMLLSPVKGNLLVAGAALPFVLAVLRLGLLFPGKGVLRRSIREPVIAGMLLVASGLLAARLLTFSPFSPDHPQPVSATQTITVGADGQVALTTLSLGSPAPIESLSVMDAQGSHVINRSGPEHSIALSDPASPVSVTQESYKFLQQSNVTVHVTMPESPRVLSVALTSDADFILYDSSFPPVRVSPREYRLLVGAFPPDPLTLQVSLPSNGSYLLTITMEMDTPLIGAQIAGSPTLRISTRVRIVRAVRVTT
jgi:hypothetical protein